MVNLANFTGDFEGMAIRVTEDGRFSVYDVLVAFLKPTNRKGSAGESINPRQVYKSLSDRNPEVVHFVDNLKFPGRGQRDTPVANEEGIYQILMLCPGKRGAEFRSWAAKIVRERREEESNGELAYTRGRDRAIRVWKRQGYTDQHISVRIKGIEARYQFTDTLQAHGVDKSYEYAQITNAIYLELHGQTAKELKAEMGLSQRDSFRDHCSMVATAAHMMAEVLATEDIEGNNLQGFRQCRDATQKAASRVARVFE